MCLLVSPCDMNISKTAASLWVQSRVIPISLFSNWFEKCSCEKQDIIQSVYILAWTWFEDTECKNKKYTIYEYILVLPPAFPIMVQSYRQTGCWVVESRQMGQVLGGDGGWGGTDLDTTELHQHNDQSTQSRPKPEGRGRRGMPCYKPQNKKQRQWMQQVKVKYGICVQLC